MKKKILCISRADVYSPQNPVRDFSMISATCDALRAEDFEVSLMSEEKVEDVSGFDAVLSMGRLPKTLKMLSRAQQSGILVLNNPTSVALCGARYQLLCTLREVALIPHFELALGVVKPPFPYWIKADGYTTDAFPVQKCPAHFPIAAPLMQRCLYMQHVEGILVKFYGVKHTGFFEVRVENAKQTKLASDENAASFEKAFESRSKAILTAVKNMAEQAASRISLDIYGGDAVIDAENRVWLIDFNDWPSFSSCRERAAAAISRRVTEIFRQGVEVS